jgi:hypothetical protein
MILNAENYVICWFFCAIRLDASNDERRTKLRLDRMRWNERESSLAARSAISREPAENVTGIDRNAAGCRRTSVAQAPAPAQGCEPELLSTLATLRRDSVVANAQFLQWDFPVRKSQEQGYIFRRDRSSQLLSGAAPLQEIAGE